MKSQPRIAVTSRSFSKHPVLRSELSSRYSNVTFNEEGKSLSGEELIAFLKGHEKAIIALETITEDVLSKLPELKTVSKYGVGIDKIDTAAMRKHQVALGWTPGVNRRSVAELALCLILSSLRHVIPANREVVSGAWRQHLGNLLTGKTVGIIGCGHVGQDLIRLLAPFECRIFINDIVSRAEFCRNAGALQVDLNELLCTSEIISLHVPLDPSTRGMISSERLMQMKKGAVLINLSRGGIVDEIALKKALIERHLSSAAFDVFLEEPPTDRELMALPHFIATPHIGGSAEEAVLAMGRAAIEGLETACLPEEIF